MPPFSQPCLLHLSSGVLVVWRGGWQLQRLEETCSCFLCNSEKPRSPKVMRLAGAVILFNSQKITFSPASFHPVFSHPCKCCFSSQQCVIFQVPSSLFKGWTVMLFFLLLVPLWSLYCISLFPLYLSPQFYFSLFLHIQFPVLLLSLLLPFPPTLTPILNFHHPSLLLSLCIPFSSPSLALLVFSV